MSARARSSSSTELAKGTHVAGQYGARSRLRTSWGSCSRSRSRSSRSAATTRRSIESGRRTEVVLFALTLPLWVVLGRLYGLYSGDEERANHSTVDDFFGVFNMLTVGAWLLFALAYVLRVREPELPEARALLAARGRPRRRRSDRRASDRAGARMRTSRTRSSSAPATSGRRSRASCCSIPSSGSTSIGFVDDHPREREEDLGESDGARHDRASCPSSWRRSHVERVIVAFSQAPHAETLELIRTLNELGVQVDVVPRLFDVLGPHMRVHAAEGMPLLGLAPARLSNSSLFLKRALDLVVSGVALVLLAPALRRRSRSRSSSTRPARCSSARCGWVARTRRSRSSSSAR